MDAVHRRGDDDGSTVPPRREEITDTMIFSPNDLVTMTCKDVDLNYATRGTARAQGPKCTRQSCYILCIEEGEVGRVWATSINTTSCSRQLFVTLVNSPVLLINGL